MLQRITAILVRRFHHLLVPYVSVQYEVNPEWLEQQAKDRQSS